MDEIQTFVGAAQQVIDMVKQVISKETQQVVSKEMQQVVSKGQVNKYFWDGIKVGIASACLLYTITHPTCKLTHEATLEEIEENSRRNRRSSRRKLSKKTLEEEEAREEKN